MTARVVRLCATGTIAQRLSEMGLVAGSDVRLVRFAPLGDPLEIEVQDYFLSLRKAEAKLVEIDPA